MDAAFEGLPPELWAEAEGIKRREKIAQALMQQAQMPLMAGEVKGRFQGAVSPFAGIAKILQAYTAGEGLKGAEAAQTGLASKYQAGLADAVSNYAKAKAGTPEIPMPAEELGGGPGAPAVPGDPRKAIAEAMASPYAPVQRMAGMDLTQLNRVEDRKDTQAFRASEAEATRVARAEEARLQREQRAADLQARLADARTTAQDRLAMQKELAELQIAGRADLARLAASLKPAPAEKPIRTLDTAAGPVILNPDGTTKPVLGGDGKPLGAKKGSAPLSATAQKELFEADDTANSTKNAIDILQSIIAKDPKTGQSQNTAAYEGGTANFRRQAMSFLPGTYEGENASVELQNKVTGQALAGLRAAFGGNPTEGERKVMLEVQGSINQKATQREEIFKRAIEMANRRLAAAQDRAKRLREGTYFGSGVATNQEGGNDWAVVK